MRKYPSAVTRDDLDSQSAEKKITKENVILQGKMVKPVSPLMMQKHLIWSLMP